MLIAIFLSYRRRGLFFNLINDLDKREISHYPLASFFGIPAYVSVA